MPLKKVLLTVFTLLVCMTLPSLSWASEGGGELLDLTTSVYGIIALIVFVTAYALVIGEEFLHLRKSKPVLVAAGIIWAPVSQ